MRRHDGHGKASLTALSVVTLLSLSAVGGFVFGKFFFGERILKPSASEVRVPERITDLELPEMPSSSGETRSYIRSISEFEITPTDDELAEAAADEMAEEVVDESTAPSEGEERTSADGQSPTYVVQIGSFLDEHHATLWRDDLNNRGYRAEIVSVEEEGLTYHRVIIGRFADRAAADRAADKLRREGYEVIVVTERPAPDTAGEGQTPDGDA